MGYEEMKGWAFKRKRRRVAKLGHAWTTDDEKLVRVCVPPARALTHLDIRSPIRRVRSCLARRSSARFVQRTRTKSSAPAYRYVYRFCGRTCAVGQLGTGALASSYDYRDHRAYTDPRGRRGLLPRPRFEPRARASGDICHVCRV
jgi:hypothetical protein